MEAPLSAGMPPNVLSAEFLVLCTAGNLETTAFDNSLIDMSLGNRQKTTNVLGSWFYRDLAGSDSFKTCRNSRCRHFSLPVISMQMVSEKACQARKALS